VIEYGWNLFAFAFGGSVWYGCISGVDTVASTTCVRSMQIKDVRCKQSLLLAESHILKSGGMVEVKSGIYRLGHEFRLIGASSVAM